MACRPSGKSRNWKSLIRKSRNWQSLKWMSLIWKDTPGCSTMGLCCTSTRCARNLAPNYIPSTEVLQSESHQCPRHASNRER